jgi:flagellar hook-associated protein 3 FlgL
MLTNVNLTTQVLFNRLQTDLERLQTRFADSVGEVANGRRANLADLLGGSGAALFGLKAAVTHADGQVDRIGIVETRLAVMQSALSKTRSVTENFDFRRVLDDATNTAGFGALVRQAATDSIEQVLSTMNASVSGRYLFSGLAVDQPPMQQTNGMVAAVEGVVAAHVTAAGGQITTTAQVDGLLAEVASMFDDTHANPALHYSGQIYQGAPDATDDLSFSDGNGRRITYGAKASEAGVRQLLEGLHLFAAVQKDDGQMSETAYQHFAGAAVGTLDASTAGIVAIEARLGLVQADTTSFREEQRASLLILQSRISAIQDADPTEAATNLASLETQLQASFLATSRILRLSLANVL